jgi:hypothetical protein
MLPIVEALTGSLTRTGVTRLQRFAQQCGQVGPSILCVVVRSPASSVLPDIESSGVFVYAGVFQPPARCAVLRPLLTSLRVAPLGSPHVRTRCFPARPPHLPARPNRATSLCCLPAEAASAQAGASSSRRARPSMRFLSVSPAGGGVNPLACPAFGGVSASLPSPGRLPSRSWPRVVGLSCCHAGSSYKGLAPHLQRAHDGRTQPAAPYVASRRWCAGTFGQRRNDLHRTRVIRTVYI